VQTPPKTEKSDKVLDAGKKVRFPGTTKEALAAAIFDMEAEEVVRTDGESSEEEEEGNSASDESSAEEDR
jgi:hypothetical protein